ncbi:1,4-alpha-glucan branching protein GlgB [Candidatus Albibeggiatoa sp. nov. NOAA]|uniref:1,4-alpha-glucan branching protein GlgB n=1 Tax=Candidatus Albibeggiatoa sp. nov. NOAA TaxID=3162724 RepID=UPI0033044ADC|nr:1,4-alpha-glucan branching protein GlgB [Thiotrichaceae bacterium]
MSSHTHQTDIQKLIEGLHPDPFSILGKYQTKKQQTVRVFLPQAKTVFIQPGDIPLQKIDDAGLFEWQGVFGTVADKYQIQWQDDSGKKHKNYDPYSFDLQLNESDLRLLQQGKHWHAYRFLGAKPKLVDGIEGVLFSIWSPNAQRISVVGDFCDWDGRRFPMYCHSYFGVWELFIPNLKPNTLYKYEILGADNTIHLKSDPYGKGFEQRPQTSSYVVSPSTHTWQDQNWLQQRENFDWQTQPISVYEVHLGSWLRDENNDFLNYRQLAHQLIDYVKNLHFTHIELLPIAEHPLDDSWGYQVTGYFAPTSRFGSPDDFRYFVDYCHQHEIGVILDWVPGHFPKDAHGLAWFDGAALYEYADPRQGEHQDWGTLIFNYARHEVICFLISNALYWLKEFHIDGLRVDAVASMLYLDYSREPGEWIPNQHGGNENLEAIEFMRQMNTVLHQECKGIMMIAEESTSWPQVTKPSYVGGLGFSIKWNMGWMHDSLQYMSKDPVHRAYHHDSLTFSVSYAFSENFILSFSHDEVVHGKKSLLDKMPGDTWQKFANLRLLYTYMWCYSGKKLLFMGCEFAQGHEWQFKNSLDWELPDVDMHQGVQQLVSDLNQLYLTEPALHVDDFTQQGFQWIDDHDSEQSVISFIRQAKIEGKLRQVIVLLNFTPIPRNDYQIGVDKSGEYHEILNSDAAYYSGSNMANSILHTELKPWMGRPYSLSVNLPPLAGIMLSCEN